MKFVNLTPHAVTVMTDAGYFEFPPSGEVARVEARTVYTGHIGGVPISATEFGDVAGLPEPSEGTAYIVSSLVAQRVPERTDVFIPNESVRDEHGRIIGCRSLGRI